MHALLQPVEVWMERVRVTGPELHTLTAPCPRLELSEAAISVAAMCLGHALSRHSAVTDRVGLFSCSCFGRAGDDAQVDFLYAMADKQNG